LQGTDSFFPWKIGDSWKAFYGSAKTERIPVEFWGVGLASATDIAGPWKRDANDNPSKIEKLFIENPVVTPAPNYGWLVVYDMYDQNDPVKEGAFGWAYSKDGLNWPPGNSLLIDSVQNNWCKSVRTPMGLIDEGNGKITMFYSGYESLPNPEAMMAGNAKSTLAIGYAELEFK
jgi:hypothetical protein